MRAFASFLVGMSGLLAAACGGPDDRDGGAPLRVGLEAAYPPFESVQADGTLVGLDVDLARAIGAHLGRPVELQNMAFDALLPELQAGRLDFVCSAVSRTPERAAVVDFSSPYARVPMGVLVAAQRHPAGAGLEALEAAGISIAVQRGTSGEKKAVERFPKARIVQFGTETEAATEVVLGRADAFVYDIVSVAKLHEKDPAATRILDLDLGTEEYAIAFPKGSPLRAPIDAFLEQGRREGGAVHAIYARWRSELDRLHVRSE